MGFRDEAVLPLPSAAKAVPISERVTARLKPCPDENHRSFLIPVRFELGGTQRRGILCTLVCFHQMNELIEEIAGVVRTRRSFGMVLHTEERQRTVTHAFVGVIVQIQVREFNVA